MLDTTLPFDGTLVERLQSAAQKRGLSVNEMLDHWLDIDAKHQIETLPALEEEVQRCHERYYSVIEAMTEGVILQDAEGKIITCNTSAERILDRSATMLIGQIPDDPDHLSIHEDGSPFPVESFPTMVTLRSGQPQQDMILGLRRPDGSVRWLSLNSQPLLRAESPLPYAVATSFTDITERKRMEDELRNSEAMFRTLVESVSVGITLHAPDGAVLLSNEAALRIVGMTKDQMLGKTPHDPDIQVIREDGTNFPVAERPILQSIATRRPVRDVVCGIYRSVSKDFVWVQVSAVPILDAAGEIRFIVSNTTNITDHKAVLQALTESERRFRRLADAAPVMIWMSDETMLCTYLNQRWIEFRGRTFEEELDDGWLEGVYPDDYDRFFDVYRKAFEGRRTYEVEYRLRRHDGVYRWVLERGIPRFSSDGRFIGYVGTAIDIGDMKAANHLLLTMNEELEARVRQRTNQLQAALAKEQEVHNLKTQFLSLVAHEFRTPLAVIITNTGILRLHGTKLTPEQQLERLHRIEAQVRRLTALVQDVTTAYRLNQARTTLSLTAVNLRHLIDTMSTELTSVFGREVPIEVRTDPLHETITTDPDMLYHVLSNLLSNAIKYSPPQGTVSVTVAHHTTTTTISVTDAGIGIPQDDQSRLFGLFQRASNVKDIQGTGLGLTIAKQCVQALEGRISFESTLGIGTTFIVELPNAYPGHGLPAQSSAGERAGG